MNSQWDKFKKSNVAKILIGYSLVAWVLIQLIEAVLPTFQTPLWVAQTLTFLLILGFPVALLAGWAVQKLPAAENSLDSHSPPDYAHKTSRKTLISFGVASCVIVGLFGFYLMPFIFDQSAFRNEPTTLGTGNSQITDISEPEIRNYRGYRASIMLGATGLRTLHNTRTDIAISNDGRSLAYVNNTGASFQDILIKDTTSAETARLLGRVSTTQGSGLLFFSQNDEWLHFIDAGNLSRVRVEGGAFQVISSGVTVARSGYTSFDERIIFTDAADGQLYSLPVSGGEPQLLEVAASDSPARTYTWPRVLPSNNHLLVSSSESATQVGIGNIELLDLETGELRTLIQTASNATYLPTGHIVFVRDASLWAVPFDLENLEITGAQVPVVQGIETNSQYGHAAYSISQDGRLFYLEGDDKGGNSGQYQISWVDRNGGIEIEAEDRAFGHMSLSPSEEQLAITVYADNGGSDIWVWDLDRKTLGRRTFEGTSSHSIWSPDGRELIYSYSNEGLRAVASDGTEQPATLIATNSKAIPTTISPDGEIVFGMGAPLKLYMLSLEETGDREVVATELPVALSPPLWHGSQISSDGNWLAYVSSETGENQIYVRPFPNINDGKWQASTIAAMQPIWHPSKNELFYEGMVGGQYSIGYEVGASNEDGRPGAINFGVPQQIFARPSMRTPATIPAMVYSESQDRFMMIQPIGAGDNTEDEVLQAQTNLVVVDNWHREIQSLAPADTL